MRLLTVRGSGQVQARSICFRVHHPAFVQGRPRCAGRPVAEICTKPRTPVPPGATRRPRASQVTSRTAAGRSAARPRRSRSDRQSGRGQHRASRRPRPEISRSTSGVKAAARIPAGQFGHGRVDKRIGGVGRCLAVPGSAPSRAERARAALHAATARFSSRRLEPVPLAGGPHGIPLIEPEGYPHPAPLVQSEMGELVPEGAREVAAIGPDARSSGSPGSATPAPQLRRAAAGEGVEYAARRARRGAATVRASTLPEAGPLGGPVGLLGELDRRGAAAPATRPW